jgi:hypothetical protein
MSRLVRFAPLCLGDGGAAALGGAGEGTVMGVGDDAPQAPRLQSSRHARNEWRAGLPLQALAAKPIGRGGAVWPAVAPVGA